MKRPLRLLLAIGLALTAANALALGLGPVHVKSKLNQPLDAEIPVIQGTVGEAEGLLVALASAEDFQRIGLNRSRLTIPLEFTVIKGADGNPVIKVTSKEAVRDPYLDFLIEANWPKGRLLREYTVLLDLPVTAPASHSAATASTPATPPSTPPPAPPPTTAHDKTKVAKQPPSNPPTPVEESAPAKTAARSTPHTSRAHEAGEQYGPVEQGETLSAIAYEARAGGTATADQMMLALYKANPQAFYRDNINALKRGAILRVPSSDEARAVGSAAEATAQVRAQIDDWLGSRRVSATRIAGTDTVSPATEPSAASVNAKASASPKTSASAPSASAPKGKGEGEHLALVPPKAGKDSIAMADRPGGGGAGSAAASSEVKAELARTREALTAAQQESGELKSRVKDLEGIQSKNARIISLKDSEIAVLQQKLKQLQDQSATRTAQKEAPPVATAPVVSAKGAAGTTQKEAPPVATAPNVSTKGAAGTAQKEAPPAVTAPDASAKSVTETAQKEALPAATASDASAKGAAGTAQKEAPPAAAAPDASAKGSTGTPPGEAPPATSRPATTPATRSTTANAAANARANAANNKPKPEPEPPDEEPWYLDLPALTGGTAAIVLLLAGFFAVRTRKSNSASLLQEPLKDDASATSASAPNVVEEINLRQQLRDDPTNLGLYLELLSLYHTERNAAKFEKAAVEMYTHIQNPRQAEWLEAQAMGRELLPQDSLFAKAEDDAESAAASTPGHADTIQHPYFNTAIDTHVQTAPMAHATAPANTLASDFAAPEVSRPIDTPAAAENIDFDAPPPKDSKNQTTHATATAPDVHAPANEHAVITPSPVAPAPSPAEDDPFYNDDTIGTKLDLAKTYIDMGDPEGARLMLEEVATEGNDIQKDEAKRLMAELH